MNEKLDDRVEKELLRVLEEKKDELFDSKRVLKEVAIAVPIGAISGALFGYQLSSSDLGTAAGLIGGIQIAGWYLGDLNKCVIEGLKNKYHPNYLRGSNRYNKVYIQSLDLDIPEEWL